MKKLYLLLLFVVLAGVGMGQVISEGFESGMPTSYTTGSATLGSGIWTGTNFEGSSVSHSGSSACKLKSATGSEITTPVITNGGVGTITLWAKRSSGSGSALQVLISVDGGTYTHVGSTLSLTTSFAQFSININNTGNNIKIKLRRSAGTVNIDDITITDNSPSPQITLSTSSLSGFSYVAANGPSSEQSFTVGGTNLTADITLTTPADYEISKTSGSGFTNTITLTQSGGSVTTTTIYTHLKSGLSAGTYNGENITASSTGAIDKTITCDGIVQSGSSSAPDLIITEIMQNPSDVSDAYGEWFEIYNYGSTTVDINGYVIKDNGSDSHTISNGGPLNIAAGGFLVLGKNSTTLTNGGVPVDYQYSGITLSNRADEIILYMSDGTTEVDRVEWDGGTNWPDPTGASMTFTGQPIDDNNTGSNWTTATVREHKFTNPGGSETDKGSPGSNGLYQNLKSTTTWTGTGNWSQGNGVGKNNWSNGSPGNKTDVIIDGNITIDNAGNSPAKSHNLTINSGKKLTISPGKAFHVSGNLTNNNGSAAGLIIQSDASGNGSLIVDGLVSGDATVQRYMPKFSAVGSAGGWHEIGCPVADMVIEQTDWDPTTTGSNNDLYYWNEVNNQWMNYRTEVFSFSPAKGYLVANDVDLTHCFTGTLNNTDITVSGLTYTSGQGEGWNLIGNPFPCAIKWNDGNWTLTNLASGTAKVWDYTNNPGNYTDVIPNDIIPSTNGFFVQVKSTGGAGSVTIPLASRIYDATNNNKQALVDTSSKILRFRVTNDENGYTDLTTLGFKNDATNKTDWNYDSHKLFGDPKAPQLWTVSNNEDFSTNFLPLPTGVEKIPLHFKAGVNTVYHLMVSGLDSFTDADKFYLEDLQTGETILLNDQPEYDFTGTPDDDVNRFVLHINGITGIHNTNSTKGQPLIYILNHRVMVKNTANQTLQGIMDIFDLTGHRIAHFTLNTPSASAYHLQTLPGVYLIKIITTNGCHYNRKIIIK